MNKKAQNNPLERSSKFSRFASIGVMLVLASLLLARAYAYPAASKPAPSKSASSKPTSSNYEWQPIPAADLDLKDNPASRGSPAMILIRESFRDDELAFETNFYRIKIFNEAGKKYADIEIPFIKGVTAVKDFHARTVHRDGSVVNFEGPLLEKEILKVGDYKALVKAFTFPDVQDGSVIEYKYRLEWDRLIFFETSSWNLQTGPFVRHALITLHPFAGNYTFHWITRQLPSTNSGFQKERGNTYSLAIENIPAFEEEDFTPPEDELVTRMDLYYLHGSIQQSEHYWQDVGKGFNEYVEEFTRKKGKVEELVRQLVSPNDPAETKLRKLYARVQQIRAPWDEATRTHEEAKRENLKDVKNVEDILNDGYAYGRQADWLFLAMARAAGFDAHAVLVAPRTERFFHSNILNSRQLDGAAVLVKVGSQDLFLDPGTRGCPYGLLPWAKTNTTGLKPDKDGGGFVTTPLPPSSDAVIQRTATLQIDSSGSLSGTLRVDYKGQEALRQRRNELQEDETERKKDLEKEIKGWLANGATFEITHMSGWDGYEDPVRVEGTVRFPGYATTAGRRILLPMVLLPSELPDSFQHAVRVQPIYFRYLGETRDDITIQLPPEWHVETLPPDVKTPSAALEYEFSAQQQGAKVHVVRSMTIKAQNLPVTAYQALQTFLRQVKTSDQQQAVLQSSQNANGN